MEWSDLLGYLLAALWLLGPALRRRQQREQQQPAEGEAAPRAPAVSPTRLIRQATVELERLEGEATALRGRLDPGLAARLGPWLDGELIPRLAERRAHLTALADGGGLASVLHELAGLESSLAAEREELASLRVVVDRRSDPELAPVHAAADRLVREAYEPFASFAQRNAIELAVGPPIPLVWPTRGGEPLLRSGLGQALLPVPGAVRLQPWLWPALGQSLGRHLQAAVPDLRTELHEALALDARGEPLTPDSPALARVFFAAWSRTLLADFIGALLFGPAYLRMLARSQGQDDPRHVATIALERDGALRPAPPAHVRVRLTGHWLAQMGLESTALGIVREWDTAHDSPALFHFAGRGGLAPIPAEPVLAHLEAIADRADVHAFETLARSKLGDVPGLGGWNALSGVAAQASRALAEGRPLRAEARALLAGAALAAFERPGSASLIDGALHPSIAGEARAPRVRSAGRGARARVSAGRPRLAARELTEALILGDVLLTPRARRAGPRPF